MMARAGSFIAPLQGRWRALPPARRTLLAAALLVIALLALVEAWDWQKGERLRLRGLLSLGDARVARMQEDIGEVERLRTQQPAAGPQGQALTNTLNASLRGRKLNLTVTMLGADRLRVQGVAGFDEAIAWLGTVQRDYRVHLVSLNAARQGGGGASQFDAVLGADQP